MEKLFNKEDLSKIKSGTFNIESLKENGEEYTACSFYVGCTGNILNAYAVKYYIKGTKIEHIFVAEEEKVSGNSMSNCVNNSRKYLDNKHNIIIDSRGIGYGAIDVLENDYLTDEGILYKGFELYNPHQRFLRRIIPESMTTSYIECAIIALKDFIRDGRLHIESSLYKKILEELSLIEYELKDDKMQIHYNKREYIDNLLLICQINNEILY